MRSLKRHLVGIIVLHAAAALAFAFAAAADPEVLYYPKRAESPRWNYALGLVELALQESGRDYVLRPTVDEMSQTRAARELELGNIDFIWTPPQRSTRSASGRFAFRCCAGSTATGSASSIPSASRPSARSTPSTT